MRIAAGTFTTPATLNVSAAAEFPTIWVGRFVPAAATADKPMLLSAYVHVIPPPVPVEACTVPERTPGRNPLKTLGEVISDGVEEEEEEEEEEEVTKFSRNGLRVADVSIKEARDFSRTTRSIAGGWSAGALFVLRVLMVLSPAADA